MGVKRGQFGPTLLNEVSERWAPHHWKCAKCHVSYTSTHSIIFSPPAWRHELIWIKAISHCARLLRIQHIHSNTGIHTKRTSMCVYKHVNATSIFISWRYYIVIWKNFVEMKACNSADMCFIYDVFVCGPDRAGAKNCMPVLTDSAHRPLDLVLAYSLGVTATILLTSEIAGQNS